MHPRSAALIAFCDAEAGADRSRRIARHLLKCEKCRGQLRRIRGEKDELAAGAAAAAVDSRQDLAGVLSAVAAWREGRAGGAEAELKSRLREQCRHILAPLLSWWWNAPASRPRNCSAGRARCSRSFWGPKRLTR